MDDVSVIIPTLGTSNILRTINSLNNGTVRPREILVCIPLGFESNLSSYKFDSNVEIVVTVKKGQVFQRSIGFQVAKSNLVMQFDDDCIASPSLISTLKSKFINDNNKIAVAPAIINESDKKASFYKRDKIKIFEIIYSFILNGTFSIKPGTVTKAGVNFGVDFNKQQAVELEVDWIPGGCMMLKKENLITFNFYPFEGKAFCEDLIHSYYLRKFGVKLLIIGTEKCLTKLEVDNTSLKKIFKEVIDDFKIRKFYLNLSNSFSYRLCFYFLINLFLRIIKFIKAK